MRILGTGSALPALTVTNDDLAKFLDTSDEWIRTHTGIRVPPGHHRRDAFAARRPRRKRGVGKRGPDRRRYRLSALLHRTGRHHHPFAGLRFAGGNRRACPALDINGACAGFLYALDLGRRPAQSGQSRPRAGGVRRGDDAAWWTGPTVPPACCLATALARRWWTAARVLLATRLTSEGDATHPQHVPQPRQQPLCHQPFAHARAVHGWAGNLQIRGVALGERFARGVRSGGRGLEDVDHFLLHQANKRIIDAARVRLKQPEEKFPMNVEVRGNTSSASLPILLDEVNRAGRLRAGDILAMSAFGAGLTTGACVLKWTKE